MIPVIFFLLLVIDSIYGFTQKPRTCNKKTLVTESVFFFHVLIMMYSVMSPFVLKDYISNFIFNATMMLSWFITKRVIKEPICILSTAEDEMCENNEPMRRVPIHYIILTVGVMLYDVYMLLRA